MTRDRIGWSIAAALLAAGPLVAAEGTVTVTGEVVDSACWIKSGAHGESHRTCAQKCADAGIPLALVEDPGGRLVWLASVDDAETPNAALRPYAGRRVTVSGSWAERGGAKILLVAKVAPASN
jgi:hypothetical protein